MGNVERIQEPDSAFYKTLLESTKAIPWQIDWKSMCFTYIGPQIEELLGWTPESWVNANDWATRMHDEDRDFVVNFCVSQSRSGIDHEADYRALTADGNYVWIRDVVHVIRGEDGEVESLVGFMFDISERKKNEQELLRLQGELEKLSYTDGLTGIANRRMFEMVLEREWAGARRNERPLSLILLDIDFFKQYNDCYGHQDGDAALKRVAGLLVEGCRSQDLVARYGGEEFAVILPETDLAAAQVVAERCRTLVLDAEIPHARSSISDYLTVSQGLGMIVPGDQDMPQTFVKVVDELLYKAKKQGRNSVGLA
ncbi:MAG TPA: sensor domain-containing diguanylate cyclase [Pseudomonadales bacterium]|nr:sensor domain-containing diguanylate cyclase [Pseudomonadales bacterium]